MRTLLSFAGLLIPLILGDALYDRAGKATEAWLALAALLVVFAGGMVFLYHRFGIAAFRWRESPLPSYSEVLTTGIILPFLALNIYAAMQNANLLPNDAPGRVGARFGLYAITIALAVLGTALLVTLVRDLFTAHRLGWGQIMQIEAARAREESAGR